MWGERGKSDVRVVDTENSGDTSKDTDQQIHVIVTTIPAQMMMRQ